MSCRLMFEPDFHVIGEELAGVPRMRGAGPQRIFPRDEAMAVAGAGHGIELTVDVLVADVGAIFA